MEVKKIVECKQAKRRDLFCSQEMRDVSTRVMLAHLTLASWIKRLFIPQEFCLLHIKAADARKCHAMPRVMSRHDAVECINAAAHYTRHIFRVAIAEQMPWLPFGREVSRALEHFKHPGFVHAHFATNAESVEWQRTDIFRALAPQILK